MLFYVINKHGLRFSIRANSRKQACEQVMRLLGKRSIPNYIMVISAI